MKIILLQDMARLGNKYDIKNVANGYAQNALIPKGLAIAATESAVKDTEQKKKRWEAEYKLKMDLLMKNIMSLDGALLEINAKANEKGHLFSGIHKAEILNVLENQKHLKIPADNLELDNPIKDVGEYKLTILMGDTKSIFTLKVTSITS